MNNGATSVPAANDDIPVRVIIVEDDMIIALALKQIILDYGWECAAVCGDAQAVFDHFEQGSADIVFMDISLRGMIDGIDAAEILLSRHGVHVIFLTSYSNPETVSRIRASPTAMCSSLSPKPISTSR